MSKKTKSTCLLKHIQGKIDYKKQIKLGSLGRNPDIFNKKKEKK
jgi:hypothetical protein